MKTVEIRKFDNKALEKRVLELREELYNLRFQHAVGQLEDSARIGKVRKAIAQILTVLNERKLGINRDKKEGTKK